MPSVSVWFLRAALLHLTAGAVIGAWLLVSKAGLGSAPPGPFLEGHATMLLLGWLAQCTLGVAHWIFPRLTGRARRGHPTAPWVGFWLWNVGVLTAAWGRGLTPSAPTAGLVVAFVGAATVAWPLCRRAARVSERD